MAMLLGAGAAAVCAAGGAGYAAGARNRQEPEGGGAAGADGKRPPARGAQARQPGGAQEKPPTPRGHHISPVWSSQPSRIPRWMRYSDAELARNEREVLRILENNGTHIEVMFGQMADDRGEMTAFELRNALRALELRISDKELSRLFGMKPSLSLSEFKDTCRRGSQEYMRRVQIKDALLKMCLFTFVAVPVASLSLAVVFGAMLAVIEQWPFDECFFLILMELSDLDIVLHTLSDQQQVISSAGGRLAAAVSSLSSMAAFGLILAVIGGPLLRPVISLTGMEPHRGETHPVRSALLRLLVLLFIGVPLVAVAISLVFGTLLAVVEEWPWGGAFFLVLGEIVDTKIDLVDMDAFRPKTGYGRIFCFLIGLWSLTIFVTVIGVISGPLLLPVLEWLHLTLKEPHEERGPRHPSNHGVTIGAGQDHGVYSGSRVEAHCGDSRE